MAAPIYCEKEYELKIELEKANDNQVFLREERIYVYDDVWAARNAYEKFFSDLADSSLTDKKERYFDRWINMIGDETCMQVKIVHIYYLPSVEEAKMMENYLRKQLEKIIDSNHRIHFKCTEAKCDEVDIVF